MLFNQIKLIIWSVRINIVPWFFRWPRATFSFCLVSYFLKISQSSRQKRPSLSLLHAYSRVGTYIFTHENNKNSAPSRIKTLNQCYNITHKKYIKYSSVLKICKSSRYYYGDFPTINNNHDIKICNW